MSIRPLTIAALVAALTAAPLAGAGDLTLILNAESGDCVAGEHRFGWLDSATAGIDANDVPEPPPPLGPYLSAGFRMQGVVSPESWRHDFRAAGDFTARGRDVWELALTPSSLPANCTVSITAGVGDPSGLRLRLSGAFADTLAVPATIAFPLGSDSRLFIEVFDEALSTESTTLGSAKCLYR